MKKMQAYIAVRRRNVLELGDPLKAKCSHTARSTAPYSTSALKDAVVRSPLAERVHGAKRRHEHRSLRGFLLQGVPSPITPRCRKRRSPLIKLMSETDKVRLVAKDTDITFSIKGIGAVPCCGKMNIPTAKSTARPCAA